MNATRSAQTFEAPRGGYRHRRAWSPEPRAAYWWINGYRAKLLIWTEEEWDNLKNVPPDAQYHPAGVWCALRLE